MKDENCGEKYREKGIKIDSSEILPRTTLRDPEFNFYRHS